MGQARSVRSPRYRTAAGLALILTLTAHSAGAESATEKTEFFEKHVRPVLAEKCYPCHNSAMKTPLGGLRLDTQAGLREGGKSGPALVPGDPGKSRIIQAVTYKEPLRMPPSGKLSDQEIAQLATWVKDGAVDPRTGPPAKVQSKQGYDFTQGKQFWAFQPVRKPPVPAVRQSAWVRSPVDAFIASKLEQQGLPPAPPSDKLTLLRRVTFDLTGLPPSPAEISAFVNDPSPHAFATVVDRLLASPRYGERWARHWLDLVRYAETNGHEYDNDKLEPWRYRDYVIRAFNDDVPYDQFVREHIAGDLLPSKRLRPDGEAWDSPLGTTSFWFNEVLNNATDSAKSRADEIDNQIDVTSKAFLGLTVACARCHDHKFDPIPTADYYALAGVLHSTDLREASLDSPARIERTRELSAKIRKINEQIESLEPSPRRAAARIEYSPEDKVFERFGESSFGEWKTEGVAFGDAPVDGIASSLAAGADTFTGTLTSPKFRTGKELYLHVRIGGTKADRKLRERGTLRFTSVCDGYKGQHLAPSGSASPEWQTLQLIFERERTCYLEIVDRNREGHILVDEIVFSASKEPPKTTLPSEEDNPVPDSASSAADKAEQLQGLRDERARLETQVPEPEFAMIAEDHAAHDVPVHIRGSHLNLGEPVPRRFLQIIAGERQQRIRAGSGRLEIADAMASPANPLTARVMVNRIWKYHFGSGIVKSADNFGRMGEVPSHPELLDYLASTFVESGWSVKAMHRLMLLSSTYQMSSTGSAEAAKKDPTNRLLQHMPVQRLEAEAIRDSVLAVSGSLHPAMYGPSVTPHISSWQEGRGKPESGPLDGNGRRSIYLQVRRNFLPPMFLAFDYPLPISAIGARTVSTVPSQALVMMNNEFVTEQASRWGRKTAEQASDPVQRVNEMYLSAFGRPAEAGEVDQILGFVRRQGERPEAAVWADVAHVLMNSPEFIYVR